jgi:eukaryotic-like serine/threonine-protein kinase
MPLQIDSMLGPYKVAGMIGEGGMGAVYRARDTRLGRDVAIKILTAVTLSDQERLARFEQEARATGMLNHPNLLTIFDIGNHEGTPYLVSELLEGETLRDRLNRGALPPRRAVEAALQMASGLAAAHEKGVVHRDLKPENIFLTRDGRVKILDFGIAKLSPGAGNDGPTFQMAATEPGMVLGTVGYMSPEQVRGEVVDARSDIFAFGAILYEILSGSRAFKRSSSIETLSAILKEEPPELADTHPNIPPALDRLVRRCLEKSRDQRFQSARDLAFNLETLSTFSTPGTLSNVQHPPAPTGPAAPAAATGAHTYPRTLQQQPLATGSAAPTIQTAASSATIGTTARPRPALTKPKRRISPVLLATLAIVAIAGSAFGGWYFATHRTEAKSEITFSRMTFRRGEIRGARFASDGDTVVYSAAWDGNPPEIFVASRQNAEARPLGIPDAEVLAVSKNAEVAILLRRDRITGLGTLARVPLAGGVPRELADQVVQADWSPDGSQLALIRANNGKYRVEYPLGKVRYETPHEVREVRVSPDGTRVAFLEPHGGEVDVVVVADGAPEAIARGWSHGANGLAWTKDGKELWVSGTSTSAPPSLYAVNLNGDMRLVDRLTGSMKLFDISAKHVLLTNGNWRAALIYGNADAPAERDYAWLDWSVLADVSTDGRTLLFNETREGGGEKNSIYIRKLDTPAAMKIGDGFGDALSPDGRLVLSHNGSRLVIVPTGSGEARDLQVKGSFDLGGVWLPDSKRVVVGGALPGKGYQIHVIDTLDEKITAISPDTVWGGTTRAFAASPDGRYVAGPTKDELIARYPTDGSMAALPVPGAEKGEVPVQWSADGLSLFVYRPTAMPARVFKIDLATGTRELWKEFVPADPAGVYKITPVVATADARAWAYNALRTTSDLYVAEGLK